MKIHLSKPGGQIEGPFTLEEINRDLAAHRYHENDFWAWYEGLGEWVPLHSVQGIVPSGDKPAPSPVSEPESAYTEGGTQLIERAEPEAEPEPGPELEPEADFTAPEPAAPEPAPPPSLTEQLFSGMPIAALEQVFILTSGDAQAASRSAVTVGMLEAITGETMDRIREDVPRHAMAGCDFLLKMKGSTSNPDAAVRAVANLNPEIVRQAREGLYRICVRTFPIETGDVVGLFLFYNKQKL